MKLYNLKQNFTHYTRWSEGTDKNFLPCSQQIRLDVFKFANIKKLIKQAGAELAKAQVKLEVMIEVGV